MSKKILHLVVLTAVFGSACAPKDRSVNRRMAESDAKKAEQGRLPAAEAHDKNVKAADTPIVVAVDEDEAKRQRDEEAVKRPEMVHGAFLAACAWVVEGLKVACQVKPEDKKSVVAIKADAIAIKLTNKKGEPIEVAHTTRKAEDQKGGLVVWVEFAEPVSDAMVQVVDAANTAVVFCEAAVSGMVSAFDAIDFAAILDLLDIDWPAVDLPEVDLPDVDVPDVDLPDVDLPDVSSPF